MGRFQGDLPERTYRFALAILALVDELPHNSKGWHIGDQLLRSGTSIGANVEEADGALTDREFAYFCNIARREAKEAKYWLRLACDGELLKRESVSQHVDEVAQLRMILTTIVSKCRQNPKRDKHD